MQTEWSAKQKRVWKIGFCVGQQQQPQYQKQYQWNERRESVTLFLRSFRPILSVTPTAGSNEKLYNFIIEVDSKRCLTETASEM